LTFDRVTLLSWRGSLILLFLLAVVGVPALFQRFRASRWDRAIGDLSYPVYLCHLLPVNALAAHGAGWFRMTQFSESVWFPLSAIGLSVALAWLLVIGLDKPMEQWRQRRVHLSARGE
jgi:peptidoglycan/LPS O-acetylase OafA/YrhL